MVPRILRPKGLMVRVAAVAATAASGILPLVAVKKYLRKPQLKSKG